jgi:hypothetical protein
MGMAKAAVLPVPVWAQPCKSLPFINIGIAFSWIGVGLIYPSPFNASRMAGIMPKSSNTMIWFYLQNRKDTLIS